MCACVCVGVSLCGGQIEEKLVVVSSISMKLPKSVQQKEQIEPCNSFCKNTNLPKQRKYENDLKKHIILTVFLCFICFLDVLSFWGVVGGMSLEQLTQTLIGCKPQRLG